MSSVSANYTLPTVLNSLTPGASSGLAKAASSKASAASTSNSSSSTSNAGTDLGTTFLSLLAQELQNQDPTAPVDPTAMVGQMISLNQLDQLISINQSVSGSSTSTTGTTTNAARGVGAAASVAALNPASGSAASTLAPSVASTATNQLPFDPNTLMPIGYATSGAGLSSINSTINAAPIGFSGSANKTTGGK
jgi:flagellar basal-body rod modification protein FlgD